MNINRFHSRRYADDPNFDPMDYITDKEYESMLNNNREFNIDLTDDERYEFCEFTFICKVTPAIYIPAYTSGLPENCHPAEYEPAEFEIKEITITNSEKEEKYNIDNPEGKKKIEKLEKDDFLMGLLHEEVEKRFG